jgi:superfamily II RNA helicase
MPSRKPVRRRGATRRGEGPRGRSPDPAPASAQDPPGTPDPSGAADRTGAPAPPPEGFDRRTDIVFRGKRLFPFQAKAAEAIAAGKNVLVAAPTGAGKTLVADMAIDRALREGRRVIYTSPIKALSNQKFRDFRAEYGEEKVGIMTGDVTIQGDAPCLVMTTEIFRNTIYEAPERMGSIAFVVFDEVHYIDDVERGTVWEESILYAPEHVRIVALSATVPNIVELAGWIQEVRGTDVEVVVEHERPVPLVHRLWVPKRGPRALDEVRRASTEDHALRPRRRAHGRDEKRDARGYERALEEATGDLLAYLRERDLLPALYFVFSRRDCEALARAHAGMDLLRDDERDDLLALFDELATRYQVVDAPATRELRRLASRGVLYHHAGMLPIDKEIVERLFTTGGVRLLFATETFALGVNMPARTVCFHALRKYDGTRVTPMRVRDYWQMAGRAGRQGIDPVGHVFAILDERWVDWRDVERLHEGFMEPVRSRFNLDYSTILNLYARIGPRVSDAWRRSFARYHATHGRAGAGRQPSNRGAGRDGAPIGADGAAAARAIERRLEALREFHYLDDRGPTRKGRIAMLISGYEIACTEAYEGGFLARCDAVEAAILFASIVYEARSKDEADPPTRNLRRLVGPFLDRVYAFRGFEEHLGEADPIRMPEMLIAGLAQAWAEGESFAVLESMGTIAAGDLVRIFRMTIQLLRQVFHAIPRGDPVQAVLREAIDRIDRDVVDAKRQLELG